MALKDILDNLHSLLARDSDVIEEGRDSISPSPCQIIPYEHERFLVAWVLLTRIPQEQLDRVWEKNGNELSYFARCLLRNIDNDPDMFLDDNDMSKNGFGNNPLCTCYIRLVAQVTARLTTPPSKELRRDLYNSWKRMATLISVGDVAEMSSVAATSKLQNATIIALSVDVYNAFVAWMDQDFAFFSSDEVMKDIWNVPFAAYTIIKQSALREQDNDEKEKGKTSKRVKPKFRNSERTVMLNVLESLLGRSIEAEMIGDGNSEGDIYTIGNVQRLIFVIFELQGTKCASDELVRSILLWSRQNNQEEMFDPDLRILWDGWLMKNIGDRISKKNNDTKSLHDPEMMDAIQEIALTHAVSPNAHALRPMAWQTMSHITKSYGWTRIQKSSIKISICTWCRLACGEWKIQLEEDGNFSPQNSNRLSILDGCGRLIISIVQHLVDFDGHPYKMIPLRTESVLSIREALEETLSLTSSYLNTCQCANDDIESAIIINLWSELFSETDILTSKDSMNMISCLTKLLLVSNDESLMQALIHVITTHSTDENFLSEQKDFDNAVIDPTVVYLEKFWKNIATPDSLKKWYALDIIHLACIATNILAEKRPERIHQVSNAMFDALGNIVRSFRTGLTKQATQLRQSLRLVIDSCVMLLEKSGDPVATSKKSYTISSAIEMLEQK